MDKLPLFPLNVFLLPGEQVQLYIFEERYKQLINQCLKEQSAFGIPFSSKINTRNFGALVVVKEVLKRYPDGEMDILVESQGLFRLDKFFHRDGDRLFPAGEVSPFNLEEIQEPSDLLKASFREHLAQSEDPKTELLVKEDLSIFQIVKALGLNELEKMNLLKLQSKARIEDYLINYIRYLELLEYQESGVYQNIYLN